MDILYSDRQVAVCIKPAGISSEAGENSLPAALVQLLGGEIFPVHRLDLNVGGVMVYARTKSAAGFLSQAVAEGLLRKEYRAIVHGTPPDSGVWEDLLWKDPRKNKVFVVTRERRGVKKSQPGIFHPGEKRGSGPGADPFAYRPLPPDPGAVCQPAVSALWGPQVRCPG